MYVCMIRTYQAKHACRFCIVHAHVHACKCTSICECRLVGTMSLFEKKHIWKLNDDDGTGEISGIFHGLGNFWVYLMGYAKY